jgi:hypothetical protein
MWKYLRVNISLENQQMTAVSVESNIVENSGIMHLGFN